MCAASGPQRLSQALSELIALRGLARVQSESAVASLWKQVGGAEVAVATRVLGFKRGVLRIAVANAPLLSELASFRKAELLESLRREQPHLNVRDLRFLLRGHLSDDGAGRRDEPIFPGEEQV